LRQWQKTDAQKPAILTDEVTEIPGEVEFDSLCSEEGQIVLSENQRRNQDHSDDTSEKQSFAGVDLAGEFARCDRHDAERKQGSEHPDKCGHKFFLL
jgi:hypothetical protein